MAKSRSVIFYYPILLILNSHAENSTTINKTYVVY